MEDTRKFKEMLTAIADRYGGEPSPLLAQMIWDSLKPYSDKDCITAFSHVFRHGRFFKDIVPDLFEFLEKKDKQVEENKAQIEVDKIISHLKFYGATEYPDLSDHITKHLMTNRWPYRDWASQVLEDEIKWWKKEFCEAYNAYQRTDMPVAVECEARPEIQDLTKNIGNLAGNTDKRDRVLVAVK